MLNKTLVSFWKINVPLSKHESYCDSKANIDKKNCLTI